jgi:hypothetical protein
LIELVSATWNSANRGTGGPVGKFATDHLVLEQGSACSRANAWSARELFGRHPALGSPSKADPVIVNSCPGLFSKPGSEPGAAEAWDIFLRAATFEFTKNRRLRCTVDL